MTRDALTSDEAIEQTRDAAEWIKDESESADCDTTRRCKARHYEAILMVLKEFAALQAENAKFVKENRPFAQSAEPSMENLPTAHNLNIIYVGRHVFSIDGVPGFFALKKPSQFGDIGQPVRAVYCRGKGTSRIGHSF